LPAALVRPHENLLGDRLIGGQREWTEDTLLLVLPVYHNSKRPIPALADLGRQVRDSPATFARKISAGGGDGLCFQAAGEKCAAKIEPVLADRMRHSVAHVPLGAVLGCRQLLG